MTGRDERLFLRKVQSEVLEAYETPTVDAPDDARGMPELPEQAQRRNPPRQPVAPER